MHKRVRTHHPGQVQRCMATQKRHNIFSYFFIFIFNLFILFKIKTKIKTKLTKNCFKTKAKQKQTKIVVNLKLEQNKTQNRHRPECSARRVDISDVSVLVLALL